MKLSWGHGHQIEPAVGFPFLCLGIFLPGSQAAQRMSDLSQPLPDFSGLTVAVVGDLIADRYIYARPTRPSREAPVMVLRQEGEQILPGGAANTARSARCLGARTHLVGCVGRDDAGHALVDRLGGEGIGLVGVEVLRGWDTPIKTRVLAGEHDRTLQQVLRMDKEPDGPAPAATRRRLGERLMALAGKVDALILSDYAYGVCSEELSEAVATFQKKTDVPVVLDPRHSFGHFHGLTAMTPNRDELARATGRMTDALEDPRELSVAAGELLARTGCKQLLVTLGKSGMALFGEGCSEHGVQIPAFGSQVVVDVTGAGDTAAATFALGLAAGYSGPEAMGLANAAASVVVMKLGAEVCTVQEMGTVLHEFAPSNTGGARAREQAVNGVEPGA
ncbi:MAG: rfaE bifunctional protein kinase chain/domain [Bacteroidia bacterium]|jgi:rfaE bifunctional protein kinase chain/domain